MKTTPDAVRLWRGLSQRQRRTILVLLITFVVVAVVAAAARPHPGSTGGRMIAYVAAHLDAIGKASDVLVDVLTLGGAIIAAVWAYYKFVGSRTFSRRISFDIQQLAPCGTSDVLVFRLVVMNIGVVRVMPRDASVSVRVGREEQGTIVFDEELYSQPDILRENYDGFDPMTYGLEPTTGMDMDFCLSTRTASRLSNGSLLLRVKSRLTAVTGDFWERTKVFFIPSHTEQKGVQDVKPQ